MYSFVPHSFSLMIGMLRKGHNIMIGIILCNPRMLKNESVNLWLQLIIIIIITYCFHC